MKLTDLDGQFVRYTGNGGSQDVATFAEAQGILFTCPSCYRKNGNSDVGVHSVLVWFRDRGVPDDAVPKPARWAASGTGISDLTLSPSINLATDERSRDEWHGFITNGVVT
jgi:hypothetical protein